MDFYTILDQVVDLLRHRKRVTYRALLRQFNLDEAFLNDLKAELIEAQHLAAGEEGNVLVWTGDLEATAASGAPQTEPQSMPQQTETLPGAPASLAASHRGSAGRPIPLHLAGGSLYPPEPRGRRPPGTGRGTNLGRAA